MGVIRWLHLSDLHFGTDDKHDSQAVLGALRRDLRELLSDGFWPLDLVFVTGDIAYSGKPPEYQLAAGFFDKLLSTLSVQKGRVYVVPGNHDVDRQVVGAAAPLMESIEAHGITFAEKRRRVAQILHEPASRRAVLQRFDSYRDFLNHYFDGRPVFADEQCRCLDRITINQVPIAIYGLNSALFSASDQDYGRLIVGEKQIPRTISSSRTKYLQLALLHHPFDCLAPFDRNDVERTLKTNCDFVLLGHSHEQAFREERWPTGTSFILSCGAGYEGREFTNTCNAVRLDTESGDAAIRLLRYSDMHGGFWSLDTLSDPGIKTGTYSFKWLARFGARMRMGGAEVTHVPSVTLVSAGVPETSGAPPSESESPGRLRAVPAGAEILIGTAHMRMPSRQVVAQIPRKDLLQPGAAAPVSFRLYLTGPTPRSVTNPQICVTLSAPFLAYPYRETPLTMDPTNWWSVDKPEDNEAGRVLKWRGNLQALIAEERKNGLSLGLMKMLIPWGEADGKPVDCRFSYRVQLSENTRSEGSAKITIISALSFEEAEADGIIYQIPAIREAGIDTGMLVHQGEVLQFVARGIVSLDSHNHYSNPDGLLCDEKGVLYQSAPGMFQQYLSKGDLLPNQRAGALLAWLGEWSSDGAFYVGSSNTWMADADGTLHIAVNDLRGAYVDNSGSYQVGVRVHSPEIGGG